MTKEESHEKVLKELQIEYEKEGIDLNVLESIWDGPSHWDKYENSIPRIVFLAKEAHSSFHPSTPRIVDDRFTKNIATWASLIIATLNINSNKKDALSKDLQDTYDRIAIVEIKKIDEGRTSSSDSNIKKFAWIGREFLKQQLEILEPNIIVCLGTLDSFDIINNYSEEEKKLYEKKIYSNKNCNCWISNNVMVIDFFHASNRKNKEEVLNFMSELIADKLVQSEYFRIMKIKK